MLVVPWSIEMTWVFSGSCPLLEDPFDDAFVAESVADEAFPFAEDFAEADDAVAGAATWVLATKPQVLQPVCAALAPLARSARPLVLSIAAGITSAQIDRWLGGDAAVVRTMPNTPALLGAGAHALKPEKLFGLGGAGRTAQAAR